MKGRTVDRAAYAAEMNARFDALERALVAKGFPATSPWWREKGVRRHFDHGGRQVVLRVGRRGGKSSTLCRIGVVEALYGRHVVPPGDLGVVAIISVNRDEASQRLRTIKAILDAIGVAYRPIDGGIELEGRSVGFKVYTASVSGVSGFTAILRHRRRGVEVEGQRHRREPSDRSPGQRASDHGHDAAREDHPEQLAHGPP